MSIPASNDRPMARLDFAWIGEAWRLFTAQPGAWIGATALYFLAAIVFTAIVAVPTGFYGYIMSIVRLTQASGGGTPPAALMNQHAQMLRLLPFSLLVAAFEAILNGGLYRMALRQYRGESINAGGVFSAFDVTWQLVLIALVLGGIGQALAFVIPNGAWVVGVVLNGLFFLAPLRVVDKRMGPIQALTDSLALLHGQRWLGIFFYLVASLIAVVGGLVCGVGALATMPLMFLTLGVSYLMMTDPRPTATPDYGQAMPGVWPPPPNVGPSQ